MQKVLLLGSTLLLLSSPCFAQGEFLEDPGQPSSPSSVRERQAPRKILPDFSLGLRGGSVDHLSPMTGHSRIQGRTDFRIAGTVFRAVRNNHTVHPQVFQFLPVRVMVTTESMDTRARLRNMQMAALVVQRAILREKFFGEIRLLNLDHSIHGQLEDFSTPIRRLDIARIRVATASTVNPALGNGLILDIQYTLPGTWVWMDDIRTELSNYAEAVGSVEGMLDPRTPSWTLANHSEKFGVTVGGARNGLILDFGVSKWRFRDELPTRNGTARVQQSGLLFKSDFGCQVSTLIPKLKAYGDLDLSLGYQVQFENIHAAISANEPTGPEEYPSRILSEFWVRRTLSVTWTMPRQFKKKP
jgi:hypothetical protein